MLQPTRCVGCVVFVLCLYFSLEVLNWQRKRLLQVRWEFSAGLF